MIQNLLGDAHSCEQYDITKATTPGTAKVCFMEVCESVRVCEAHFCFIKRRAIWDQSYETRWLLELCNVQGFIPSFLKL